MLKQSIIDFQSKLAYEQPIFFDRGIPDLFSYARRFVNKAIPKTKQSAQLYRYNDLVFMFPPWPEIYTQDTERKQTQEEAIETYEAVKSAHIACGYTLVEVPKVSIIDRVNFILTKSVTHLI